MEFIIGSVIVGSPRIDHHIDGKYPGEMKRMLGKEVVEAAGMLWVESEENEADSDESISDF